MSVNNFYGKVSPSYLNEASSLFLPLKLMSYRRMNICAGEHVLDVGCGPGIDVINLSGEVGENGNVTGFDHDLAMLQEGLVKIKNRPLKGQIFFVQGDAEKLPFPSNFFDHCRSERLFMHLPEPQRVLTEMVRVIKPGGRVVVVDTDWSSVSIDTPYPEIENVLRQYRINHVLNNGYSGRSLFRHFRNLNLEDVEVELFPIALTSLELFDFISMQPAIESQALANRVLTRQALDDWRRALQKAAQQRSFFCSANIVMVSATKTINE